MKDKLKVMKENKGLGITLGFMCFVLVFAVFLQIRTIEKSDSGALRSYREDELRTEVLKWKDKYDQMHEKFLDNEEKLEEYRNAAAKENESTALIKQELTQANAILGMEELRGEGVIIKLYDTGPNSDSIVDIDLLGLVNELKSAGAEAISINGQRLITNSEIRNVNIGEMAINGETIVSPYTIRVIGKKDNLESILKISGNPLENLRRYNNVTAEFDLSNDVIIPKYNGVIKFKYAQIVKE